MKGIGRNLLFWGYNMERMFLGVIGVAVFCSMIGSIIGGEGITRQMETLPQYLVLMLLIVIFMNALNGVLQTFSISVSLGSGRKTCYIAMQIVQHILALQCVILCIIIYSLTLPEILFFAKQNIVFLILVLGVIMIMSNLISVVSLQFGRSWAVVFYILVVFGGIFTLILGVVNNGSNLETIMEVVHFLNNPIFFVLSILLDMVFIWLGYRIIQKKDLQF